MAACTVMQAEMPEQTREGFVSFHIASSRNRNTTYEFLQSIAVYLKKNILSLKNGCDFIGYDFIRPTEFEYP
jgi:hypothetical protein